VENTLADAPRALRAEQRNAPLYYPTGEANARCRLRSALQVLGGRPTIFSSRLFTERTHDAIVKSIWALWGDKARPEGLEIRSHQDAYLAVIDSPAHNHYGVDGQSVVGISRSSHFLQANWDGSVGAGAWFGDDTLQDAIHPSKSSPDAGVRLLFWGSFSEATARLTCT
jgi:hypothetical protein